MRRLVPTILATLSLLIGACGGGGAPSAPAPAAPSAETLEQRFARLYDGAKSEGRVAFYSSMTQDDASKIVPLFESKFPGIKVEHTRATGEKLVQRLVSEKKAGQDLFDVLETNSFEVKFVVDQGYTQPYKVASWDDFRPESRDNAGQGWIAARLNNDLLGFNTNFIKPGELKTWKDLCDKKYEGHIAVEQDDVVQYTAHKAFEGERAAQDLIRCIAANKPRLVSGHSEMANLLAAGEYWAVLATNGHRLAQLKYEKKAPIDWVRTDPVITDIQIMVLANRPPHANAAKLFMEWLTSPEGQSAIQDTGRVPASTKVPLKYPDLMSPGRPFFLGPDLAKDFNKDAEFWRTTFGIK